MAVGDYDRTQMICIVKCRNIDITTRNHPISMCKIYNMQNTVNQRKSQSHKTNETAVEKTKFYDF